MSGERFLSRRFPQSTAIEQAAYRPASSTLDIRYRGGDRYTYFDVPPEVYDALCAAPSAGEFVNAHVKPLYRHEIEPRRRRFRPD